MTDQSILEANIRWALGDLLAWEKHLIEAKSGGSGAPDSWCAKKHSIHLSQHSLLEAIQLNTKSNPKLCKALIKFRKKVDEAAENNADDSEIRDLRNEFREIVGDSTLKSKCPICRDDKLHHSKDSEEDDETEESEEGFNKYIPFLAIGGVLIGVGILGAIRKSQITKAQL